MKKALVIQEDIVILKILERLMNLHKYDCKAIRAINDLQIEDQSVNFDIIISDILFDGIAPLDFVFQIQEIILHKSLIIVTNMGQQKIRLDILSSEKVDGFFAIPFDMEKIENLIS
ncbi:MAG: response regulator [Bacteroidota bacterium]